MKLHLPSGLRKSLLACLAALSLPALSLTLSSASSLLGGAALVSFFAAEQVSAYAVIFNTSHTEDRGGNLVEDPDPIKNYDKGYCEYILLNTNGRILFQGGSWEYYNMFSTWVVEGDISGTGNLTLDTSLFGMGLMELNHGGNLNGKLCFESNNTDYPSASYVISMGEDLRVKGLLVNGNEDNRKKFSVAFYTLDSASQTSKLIVDTAEVDVDFDGNLTIGDVSMGSANFEKTGAGTQTISGSFNATGAVEVSEGQLLLMGSEGAINGSVSISGDATLELHMSLENDEFKMISLGAAAIALDGGTLKFSGNGSSTETPLVTAGRLTVGARGGHIVWSADGSEHDTGMELSFSGLSSSGDEAGTPVRLEVDPMTKLSASVYQRVHFENITNFNGELLGNTGESSHNRFYIRRVNQDLGYRATINVTGNIYAEDFRKMGEGALHINGSLFVSGELFMDYEGELEVQSGLSVLSNSILRYASGSDENLLSLELDTLLNSEDGTPVYNLDIDDVDEELLSRGISMGITGDGGVESLKALRNSLSLLGYDDQQSEWDIYWGGTDAHTVYLSVTGKVAEAVNENWDSSWGMRDRRNAPSAEFLDEHEYNRRGSRGEFASNCLQLSVDSSYHSASMSYVRLTEGGMRYIETDEEAGIYGEAGWTQDTVIGGRIYQNDAAGDTWIEKDYGSYISMKEAKGKTVRYHLLVGGSSCLYVDTVSSSSGTAFGGFIGNSHIQVDGGTVDYIVGGNHVNNSAFTFIGDSYISVKNGLVNGGIVGGSTLTKGSANTSVHAFRGNSNIFVYTVLSGSRADAPQISDDTVSGTNEGEKPRRGAAFAAIVGGNAWIDLPEGVDSATMAPTFRGSSRIVIDLLNYVGVNNAFEKDIVGGNYTAIVGSTEGSVNRNTNFNAGDRDTLSTITITTPQGRKTADGEDNDIVFSGGINGASRRGSVGGGTTNYTGSTLVSLTGGIYKNYVAGGLWFDESANGAHTAQLTGDTTVEINRGTFWRVAGGSVSMGGSGNASENQTGDSQVLIRGGSFGADHMGYYGTEDYYLDQTQMSFVAGGDFYRNNMGGTGSSSEGNRRTGNTSVVIDPGASNEVRFENGVHIVGGDYVNSSAVGSLENGIVSTISGTSEVRIGDTVNNGAAVYVEGLVVGGSWLTDTGRNGTVSLGNTSVKIYHGSLTAIEGSENEYEPGRDLKSGHYHRGLAVVGGSVIVEENASTNTSSGRHSATVSGTTSITIGAAGLEGPSVKGDIVGGSYANQTKGTNTLSSGAVEITINSGSIVGNVYGGHYSASVDSPDQLSLGNVHIVMNGGQVTGNIVGGGYRSTASDATGSFSKQGDITIELLGGTLDGNVYAAGWNAAVSNGGSAKTQTTSTTVRIGEDFRIADTASLVTISGGYGRANGTAVTRSTVEKAKLEIVVNNQHFGAAAQAGRVNITDFNEVFVADGLDLVLGSDLVVMGGDLLTKSGDGVLSVRDLKMRNVADNDTIEFTGQLALNGGSLCLQTARDITPGLRFGLGSLAWHNEANRAYLQVENGLVLNGRVKLFFDGMVEDLSSVAYGTYYLATGLDEGMTDEDNFDYDIDALSEALEDSNRYLQVRVVDGNLVLLVRDVADRDLFFWDNKAQNSEWKNDSREGWQESHTAPPASPSGHNVYFDATGQGTVNIAGQVTPRSVWVQSGTYTFTGGEGAVLNIGAAKENVDDKGSDGQKLEHQLELGQLAVGGEGREAQLTLKLAANMKQVLLKDRGTLVLDAPAALPGTASIAFQGGVLEYGSGFSADVSTQVNRAASSGRVRLSVAKGSPAITWGSESAKTTNSGIALALDRGMDKLGEGAFTMEWTADNARNVNGRIHVEKGSLTYRVHAASGNGLNLAAEGGNIVVGDSSASLTLEVVGSGRMNIDRAFSGAGTVRLSKAANSGSSNAAPFYLNADNSSFAGTLALVGNSSVGNADMVQVVDGSALGGSNTRLVLSGMGIMLPASYKPVYAETDGDAGNNAQQERLPDIQVRRITVSEGTVNYVGGTSATPSGNSDLYLTSTELLGTGTLSNAWGNGSFAYQHTYEGSLGGFSGTIVAGDARSRATNTSVSTISSWTLVDVGGGDLNTNFAGSGSIIFNFSSSRATRLLGHIGDAVAGNVTSLENVGVSELVIAGGIENPNTATGSIVTHSGKKVGLIRLGDNENAGTWAGRTVRGDGSFVLTNGALTGGGINSKDTESTLLVETTVVHNNNPNVSTSVDVGGTDGALLDGITITAGGRLSGVGGDINVGDGLTPAGRPFKGLSASLTFGLDNMDAAPAPDAPAKYLIEMQEGDVVVNDPSKLKLDFTNDAFATVLESMIAPAADGSQNVAWLHIVTGGNLVIDETLYDSLLAVSKDSENGLAALLGVLGFRVAGLKDGDLGISGQTNEAYIVLRNEGDPGTEGNDPTVPPLDSNGHGYGILSAYSGTVVTEGKTLTINLLDKPENEVGEVNAEALARDIAAGGALVNNLVGLAGSTLRVNNVKVLDLGEGETLDLNDAANRVTAVLHNSADYKSHLGSEAALQAAGVDTSFDGTITAGAGVDMVKAGKGTLTVGAANGLGGLQLAEGDMRMVGGGLTLQGKENTIRSLTFAYAAPAGDLPENRTVTLRRGLTTVGSLVEDGESEARRGGDIVLEDGAELLLTGGSFLSDTVISQGKGELGTVTIDAKARLTFGGLVEETEEGVAPHAAEDASTSRKVSDQLQGVNLKIMRGGVVDMALSSATVNNLSGGGTLTGSGGSLPSLDGVLSIDGSGEGIFSGSFEGVGALRVLSGGLLTLQDAVGGSAWALENSGELVIDLRNNVQDLALGEVTLRSGSVTRLYVNTDKEESMSMVNAGLFVVEEGAGVEVHSSGEFILTEPELTLAHVSAVPSRSDVSKAEVKLKGVAFLHFQKTAHLYMKGNDVVVGLQASDHNEFITPGMHKNALAGAKLFWAATDTATNERWASIAKDSNSDLYKMAVALGTMLEEGRTADLNRTLAAGAGASAAVLSSAIAQDVERQLRSIRNRTTTMGSEMRYDGNTELPLYHMWITGESAYHKMGADGLAPGYTLNSWGGTVGMDADVSASATVGLAVSAMYGDLKTNAPDASRGDTTTTYLSGFARVSSGAWMHTLVVTAGLADVKLDRTVNYGSGFYNTRGHTNGYQLGALYELGYARALNAKGTTVLQGVANVEVRHASLGSYDELNTEAGLHVSDLSYNVITFGVGARLQSVVAENALNRASILEARALVKADAGDRKGKASTSLIHGAANSEEVESAEMGVMSLELGAGLTLPIGRKGACFIDASAELRSGYTELNANVGYRLSF